MLIFVIKFVCFVAVLLLL